jgi:cytochrome c|tara:strand:- start:415 stop:978 length:564 start_codon:yes stop_codon:yes gene_type:complete
VWSTNTNNIVGAVIVALWLLAGSNFIGNLLIPPFEPVHDAVASTSAAKAPEKNVTKQAAKETAAKAEPAQSLSVLLASADAGKGKKIAKKCVACHTFDKGGKNKVGPNLFAIMGKDRASVAKFNYSGAIKKMGGKWGFDDMDKFLTKPKVFMPGTKMVFTGLKKAGDRAAVILYLRSFADAPMALPK